MLALRSFEARLWAAGITTVFHGIGFDDRSGHARSLDVARELWDAVTERRRSGRAAVDHRVLYRLEARTEGGFEAMRACLEDDDAADVLPLVSYEDHTPGQGQYRNLDRFLDAMSEGAEPGGPGPTREQRMAEIMAQAAATQDLADRNRSSVAALASSGRVRALAHDVVDAEGMQAAFRWGARVAEFPITVEAARAALLDLPVVCGGPNAQGPVPFGERGRHRLVGQEPAPCWPATTCPPRCWRRCGRSPGRASCRSPMRWAWSPPARPGRWACAIVAASRWACGPTWCWWPTTPRGPGSGPPPAPVAGTVTRRRVAVVSQVDEVLGLFAGRSPPPATAKR
ncbi:MAG: hypothetical protein R2749_21280 [Acidimicrobiales bacterium]